MNNNTIFTDEEIKGIYDLLEVEYIEPLTERQIINVAREIEQYEFLNDKERLLALEYASRLRNEMTFYVNSSVPFNKRKYYSGITSSKYVAKRIYKEMYPESLNEIEEIKNKKLDSIVERVLFDLKVEMNKENESLEKIKKDTKVRKLIIKRKIKKIKKDY